MTNPAIYERAENIAEKAAMGNGISQNSLITSIFTFFSHPRWVHLLNEIKTFTVFGKSFSAFPIKDPLFIGVLISDALQAYLAWRLVYLGVRRYKSKKDIAGLVLNALIETGAFLFTAFGIVAGVILLNFGITLLAHFAAPAFLAGASLKLLYNVSATVYYGVGQFCTNDTAKQTEYREKASKHAKNTLLLTLAVAAIALVMVFAVPALPFWVIGVVGGAIGAAVLAYSLYKHCKKNPAPPIDKGSVTSFTGTTASLNQAMQQQKQPQPEVAAKTARTASMSIPNRPESTRSDRMSDEGTPTPSPSSLSLSRSQ